MAISIEDMEDHDPFRCGLRLGLTLVHTDGEAPTGGMVPQEQGWPNHSDLVPSEAGKRE